MFILPDLVATPFLAFSVYTLSQGNPWGLIGVLLSGSWKMAEGFYAATEATQVKLGKGAYPRKEERFGDAAFVLGAFPGFGIGHVYAEGKLSWRAAGFAIADTLALALLIHATNTRVVKIDPYVWGVEGVRIFEAVDAALLAKRHNDLLPALKLNPGGANRSSFAFTIYAFRF